MTPVCFSHFYKRNWEQSSLPILNRIWHLWLEVSKVPGFLLWKIIRVSEYLLVMLVRLDNWIHKSCLHRWKTIFFSVPSVWTMTASGSKKTQQPPLRRQEKQRKHKYTRFVVCLFGRGKLYFFFNLFFIFAQKMKMLSNLSMGQQELPSDQCAFTDTGFMLISTVHLILA